MTDLDDEEEEKLRDIAVRFGAAIGMGPEEVFERLICALRADSLFDQRKRVEAMKDNWWDKAMFPVYQAILDGLPPDKPSEKEEAVEQKMREVEYEFEKLCCVIPFPDSFWKDAEIPALKIANLAHERFVRAIITWKVARRRLAEYRWPATWRDAFKERWFPAWAKERWPVRYEKVALDELAAMRSDDENVRYFI